MEKPAVVRGVDLPIVQLTPLKKRSISQRDYRRMVANIKAIGLIEPICVCQEGSEYYILDGYLRYQALMELGVESAPCLVLESRDLYTCNRQVNHLSRQQQTKMIRKALERVDEKTLLAAFGQEPFGSHLRPCTLKEMHPAVKAAMDSEKIQQVTARELTLVTPKRQLEILGLMKEAGDWSLAFAKAQILRTPQNQRNKKRHRKEPWDRSHAAKRDLVRKLQEVEKHYDFYSALYRQYTADLIKLASYMRQIVNRARLRRYLTDHHLEILKTVDGVMKDSEGKAAAG